jgi:hypothetical protein
MFRPDQEPSTSAVVEIGEPEPPGLDDQTAHLFEAFGRMRFTAAEPLLLTYVPKSFTLGMNSRRSAIWSIGLLHAGVSDEPLAQKLMDRIADDGPPPDLPELGPVKQMSAVSLARIKATSQTDIFRKYVSPFIAPNRLGMTFRWALMDLTGEQIPEPAPTKTGKTGWFLEPLDD